ncbi:hypothetical protein Pelo_8152 [Pelomyxa schiedti]|nr:hypothetical protein Pelo_8152 [Pelomyxa schiedti]
MALSYYAKVAANQKIINILTNIPNLTTRTTHLLLIGISVLPAKNPPPPSPQRQQLTHASSAAGSIAFFVDFLKSDRCLLT